jgi:hypothetical protein
MAIQTSFAKKVAASHDGNHRFLALLGNDGELDLALLYVKDRVRDLSLRENNLILPVITDFPCPTLARNILGSEFVLPLLMRCLFAQVVRCEQETTVAASLRGPASGRRADPTLAAGEASHSVQEAAANVTV